MKLNHETGRTMLEMMAVLAIVGVLSVGAIAGFRQMMMKHKINDIIHAINLNSVQILNGLAMKRQGTPDEMDAYLQRFATQAGGYNITFKAPRDADREFTGTEFVAEITDTKGGRLIWGDFRKDLLLLLMTMVKVNGVSDVDFSVRNEPTEEGTVEDVTMRLSGKAVDLNALCGKDVL